MRALVVTGLAGLLACSCTNQRVAYRDDLDRHSMVIAEVRTELADATRTLHTVRTELEILEDRINRQDVQLKKELGDLVTQFDDRVSTVEQKQSQVAADLRCLNSHCEQTSEAIAQAHKEVRSLRRDVNQQVSGCKQALETVMAVVQSEPGSYRVKRGDTLDKIAKAHATSIQNLKLANGLNSDTIFPDQELLIPRE